MSLKSFSGILFVLFFGTFSSVFSIFLDSLYWLNATSQS